MIENKKFDKKQVNRAIEELKECHNNILNTCREQYPHRIKQLIATIKNNEILNFIISPYIDMEFSDTNIGFREVEHSQKLNMIIPENEDEEIALMLKYLILFSKNESIIDDHTSMLSMISNHNESLSYFNKNYIEPAFRKLLRKLQYKIEDIGAMSSNEIDAGDITIINIEKLSANNAMIAIGKNITQQNENIFKKIKNEIQNNVKNENDKAELLSCVSEMERNKANKEIFKNCYDRFINKLGTYMTIIGPLLPYLVDYFK